MTYFISLSIIIIFACTYKHADTSWRFLKSPQYVITFLVLTCIAGFAYELGADTDEYLSFYRGLAPIEKLNRNIIESYRYQAGFTIFCSFLRQVSDNYLLFQIVHALLLNIVIFRFVKKFSTNPYLALLVYCVVNFLEFNFEIQRESLAVVCGMFAFEMWEMGKKYIALGFVVLGYFFHFSILAILFLPLIQKFKPTNKNLTILVVMAALSPWVWQAIPNAELLLALTTDQDFYEHYINQSLTENYNLFYYVNFYLVNIIIPGVALFILRNKEYKYKNLIIGFMVFRSMSLFSYAFYRFSNFYAPFYWIILGEALYYLVSKYKSAKFIIVIASVYFIFNINNTKLMWFDPATGKKNYERYYPYVSVFEDNKY